MENQARGRKDIATNEYDVYELRRLREKAKIASIFHGNRKKFQRNPHLSHVVHACLNISQVALIGSFVGALFMILLGIMEMKHADIYLDLTKITDDELLQHPIFIHNFVMCLLSIACMIMYLIQGWVLFDYYQSVRKNPN
ncbi:hypothetical protein WN55_05727 [Dufourea novaeangliae]|uniref:Uncharacterized protein n=1 Tax=Dufourea novaeangliae TaxID=178035 RepID=A0A154PPL6_DUFNO|nr:hypothetical protein WN55_05727 [Dufourea novaeangliae]